MPDGAERSAGHADPAQDAAPDLLSRAANVYAVLSDTRGAYDRKVSSSNGSLRLLLVPKAR
jgi:hypothetical protein